VLKGKTIRGAASLFFNFSLLPYIRDTLLYIQAANWNSTLPKTLLEVTFSALKALSIYIKKVFIAKKQFLK